MNKHLQYLTKSNAFGCFEVSVNDSLVVPAWVDLWRQKVSSEKFSISSRHNEALARLMPFLLCGEQSAIQVFGAEVDRLRESGWSKSVDLLKDIESDEYGHEMALRTLSQLLMQPADLGSIKRQAQHFYLKLGNTAGMTEHFARVAQLDACACIIMNEISNSDLGQNSPVSQLLNRIKKDEARHVNISKKHFLHLGGVESTLKENGHEISEKLVALLRTEADSFESLGVDSDQLFRKLTNARQAANPKQVLKATQPRCASHQ